MTTPRARRKKHEQARDILLALLKEQEAKAAEYKAAYEGANLRATTIRQAIELLDQTFATLPGMELTTEVSSPPENGVVITLQPTQWPFLGEKALSVCPHSDTRVRDGVRRCSDCGEVMPDTAAVPSGPSVGEKAQGISDVWNPEEGAGTVHTTLMHAREQVADRLRALLRIQEDKANAYEAVWPEAQAEADQTRLALEAVEGPKLYPGPDIPTVNDAPAEPSQVPRPHRQRIGEKPQQHISDVWDPEEGQVTVHTALMYERQESCEWCLAGVPFYTEERTEHRVVLRDTAGEYYEYRPCLGVGEYKEAE